MAIDREKWERILEEAEFPENYGERGEVFGESINAGCGDWVRIGMTVREGRITEMGFVHRGCMISKAAASIITKMAKGRGLDEAGNITLPDLLEEMGRAVETRIKCAKTAYDAFMDCMEKARKFHGGNERGNGREKTSN